MNDSPHELVVRDLGRMTYAPALALQREINLAVSLDETPDTLLLVEHDPVITVSHRKGVENHILASPLQRKRLGVELAETDRGGDVTYHGPGQLVAYPILRLDRYGLNLARYMRLLEQVIIDAVAGFDVTAIRDSGATGVWVDRGSPPAGEPALAKLAALGVRVRKHTTLHGLALNVTTDLTHFQLIDPCGLGHRPVTSLHALLGSRCPDMDTVKTELAEQLRRSLAAGSTATPKPPAA
ncbi:MAG: lipoyl(octanoyl) transferase LipB [Planctomycetota bacterium]